MALSPELRKVVSESRNRMSRSNTKTLKPKEGANRYRFLAPTFAQAPWVGPNGKFWAELGVHWIKTEKDGKPVCVVGSPDVCYQQPSMIDTAIDMAIGASYDEDTKKLFEEMKANKSVLFNVLDRSNMSAGVQILEIKPTAATQFWDLLGQHEDEGVDMLDPATGIDVIITRSGKGFDTTYTVNPKPGASEPIDPKLLTQCHDLPAYIAQEFFKGEEPKALATIVAISGITLPGMIGSAPRTPTPALTSASTTVADAPKPVANPVVAEKPAVDPAAAALAAEKEKRRQALLAQKAAADAAAAELAALEAEEATQPETTAALATSTPATPAPTAAELATSEADQIDDVLAELDMMTKAA